MAVPSPPRTLARLDASSTGHADAKVDPLRGVAQRLRVRLVAGSLPPDLCGVGHYSARLAEALAELGVDVELLRQDRTDRLGAVTAAQPKDAIVHLQYPTVGVGASFGPLLGMLRRRQVVLTLHEFSYVHPLRRAMAAGLANVAAHVVVSNSLERDRLARRLAPLGPKRITVLPVPTNIPTGTQAQPRAFDACSAERPFTVGYFGIVRPDQGFAQFLAMAEHAIGLNAPARFVVIGGWHRHDEAFVADQQRRTEGWPLRWTGRLDDEAVSAELAQLDAAYLPYPDGLSERRASAAAMFAHRVPVVTTAGRATTAALRAGAALVKTPVEAWAALTATGDDHARQRRIIAAEQFLADRSFEKLAVQHVALYQSVRVAH